MDLLGQSESTVLKILQMWSKKPTLDTDLSGVLDKFLEDLNTSEEDLTNGVYTNFTEAALVLQNSVELYGKKVDILWHTAFDYSKRINEYETNSDKESKNCTKERKKKAVDENSAEKTGEESDECSDDEDSVWNKAERNARTALKLLHKTILQSKEDTAVLDRLHKEHRDVENDVVASENDVAADPTEIKLLLPGVQSDEWKQELVKAKQYLLNAENRERYTEPSPEYCDEIETDIIDLDEPDEEDNKICTLQDLRFHNFQEKYLRCLEIMDFAQSRIHIHKRTLFKRLHPNWWAFPAAVRTRLRKYFTGDENERRAQAREKQLKRIKRDLEAWCRLPGMTDAQYKASVAAQEAGDFSIYLKAMGDSDWNNNALKHATPEPGTSADDDLAMAIMFQVPDLVAGAHGAAAADREHLSEVDLKMSRAVVKVKRMSIEDMMKYTTDLRKNNENKTCPMVELRLMSTDDLVKFSETEEFRKCKDGVEAGLLSPSKRKCENLQDTPKKKPKFNLDRLVTAQFDEFEQFCHFNYSEYQENLDLSLSKDTCSLHNLEQFVIKRERPDSECDEMDVDFQGFDSSCLEEDATALVFDISGCRSCCRKQCFPSEHIRASDFDAENEEDFVGFDAGSTVSGTLMPLLDESGFFREADCTSCCHRMLAGPDFLNESHVSDVDEDFDFGAGGLFDESDTGGDDSLTIARNAQVADDTALPLSQDSGIDLSFFDAEHDDNVHTDDSSPALQASCTVGTEAAHVLPSTSDTDADTFALTDEQLEDLEAAAAKARERQQWTEIQNSVAQWRQLILPRLKIEEKRELFDIHKYGSEIMDAIQPAGSERELGWGKRTAGFGKVADGKAAFEVARYFSALLQLINTGNVAIADVPPCQLADGCLEMRLLTRERYHEHLDDYHAPSEDVHRQRETAKKRKKQKEK